MDSFGKNKMIRSTLELRHLTSKAVEIIESHFLLKDICKIPYSHGFIIRSVYSTIYVKTLEDEDNVNKNVCTSASLSNIEAIFPNAVIETFDIIGFEVKTLNLINSTIGREDFDMFLKLIPNYENINMGKCNILEIIHDSQNILSTTDMTVAAKETNQWVVEAKCLKMTHCKIIKNKTKELVITIIVSFLIYIITKI